MMTVQKIDTRPGMIGARGWLVTGVSALALVWAPVARAQEVGAQPAALPPKSNTGATGSGDAAGNDEIIVTGIRAANLRAIELKRRSDTIVDAITAEDIGALPDRSITEALQRIPGVAVNRFQAVNDPDHVSEEGQSPVIRGLPYVQSMFNGRDAFTANRGRALDFQDIPPDLASAVEVYKQQTADILEGGIAGNINIVTRRPLDSKKDLFVINADGNWGDLRNRVTPEVSGLISKQWDTGAGRFGILASASYSRIDERVENARVTTYRDFRSADPTRGILASTFGGQPGGQPGVDYYVPIGGGYSRQDNNRERIGLSGALQWESNDGRFLATIQEIHSDRYTLYTERTIAPVEDTGSPQIVGGVGAATFDKNNVFLKGTLDGGGGNGIDTQELSRGEKQRSITNDLSGHLAWKATDRLKFDVDVQWSTSSSRNLDSSVVAIASTVETLDNSNGFPITSFAQPTRFSGNFSNATGVGTSGYNNQPIGFFTTGTSPTADPNTTFWRSSQDHEDNTHGHEFAYRADGQFDFAGDSFLKNVRFGARYADRTQRIRSDGYNWGNLSERWNAGITTPTQATPPGFGVINLGSFFRGATPGYQVYGFVGNPATGYNQLQAGDLIIKAVHPSFGYNGLGTGSRNNSGTNPASITNGAGDGFHTLGEVSDNDEKNYAGYVRLDFGTRKLGGWTFDGNVGVRYVRTDSTSSGYYQVPNVQGTFLGLPIANGVPQLDCSNPANGHLNDGTNKPGYNLCLNTAAFRQQLFNFLGTGNVTYTPSTTSQTYDDFLPSVNLRLSPKPDLQFRFAYSKAVTRPSFNDLRNFTTFSVPGPVGTLAADAPLPDIALKAQAYGNPLLRPTKSDNFDLTAEWYHSKNGSFTIGLFYKDLTNVNSVLNGIATSNGPNGGTTNNIGVDPTQPSVINFTNNGVTLPANIVVTANNNRHVGVRGLELDWRENRLPFLPSAFDGFGFSFNFTYIDADKLKFQPVLAANYDSSAGTGYNPNTGYLTSFPFPGVSKYNLNAEVFYEKYGVQARIAYSWRSSYFISSQDSLGPNDPTYTDASGFLDGSLFYAVTKNIKIGATASNILNETITTRNVITSSGIQALRAINQADRRVTAGVRIGF